MTNTNVSKSSRIELIGRIMGTDFVDVMKEWREAGDSYDTMKFRLYTQTHIEVSRETLRRWCKALEIEQEQEGEK